jgi:hypothetical protein
MLRTRQIASCAGSAWLALRTCSARSSARHRLTLPADRPGVAATVIGEQLDPVVLTHTVAFLLQSPDALPELVDALAGAGTAEPFGEIVQLRLEALRQAYR